MIKIKVSIFFSMVISGFFVYAAYAGLVPGTITLDSGGGGGICNSYPCDYVSRTCSSTSCDPTGKSCTTSTYDCSYYASTCYTGGNKTYVFGFGGGKLGADSSISCSVSSVGIKNVGCNYSSTDSYFTVQPNQLGSKSVGTKSGNNSSCSLEGRKSTVDNNPPEVSFNQLGSLFDTDADNWCNMEKYLRDDYGTDTNPLLPGCEYYKVKGRKLFGIKPTYCNEGIYDSATNKCIVTVTDNITSNTVSNSMCNDHHGLITFENTSGGTSSVKFYNFSPSFVSGWNCPVHKYTVGTVNLVSTSGYDLSSLSSIDSLTVKYSSNGAGCQNRKGTFEYGDPSNYHTKQGNNLYYVSLCPAGGPQTANVKVTVDGTATFKLSKDPGCPPSKPDYDPAGNICY